VSASRKPRLVAKLRVRIPSGASGTFRATACRIEDGLITATGWWTRECEDPPRTYTWSRDELLQVRWYDEAGE
jgi:hypothetical protein